MGYFDTVASLDQFNQLFNEIREFYEQTRVPAELGFPGREDNSSAIINLRGCMHLVLLPFNDVYRGKINDKYLTLGLTSALEYLNFIFGTSL